MLPGASHLAEKCLPYLHCARAVIKGIKYLRQNIIEIRNIADKTLGYRYETRQFNLPNVGAPGILSNGIWRTGYLGTIVGRNI